MAIVTRHAMERYVERIRPGFTLSQAEAEIMVSSPTIAIAAAFGAREVRTGHGARLVLEGDHVVTVKLVCRPSAPGSMIKRYAKAKRERQCR